MLHAGDLVPPRVLAGLRALGRPVAGGARQQRRRGGPPRCCRRPGWWPSRGAHRDGPRRRGRPPGAWRGCQRRFPDADAVIFGHSHIPLHETDPATGFQIFNPGQPDRPPPAADAHDGAGADWRGWRGGLRADRPRVNVAERVQASIRAVNAAERNVVVAGAFTLYRNRASDHPVSQLRGAERRGRRWEGIDALRAAFAAHGLGRAWSSWPSGAGPGGGAGGRGLRAAGPLPGDDAPGVRRCARCPRRRSGHRARPRRRRRAGAAADRGRGVRRRSADGRAGGGLRRTRLLARAGGEPAGAAFPSEIAEGASELGGIGVRERFRRRGIAAALTGGRRGRRRGRRRRPVLPDSGRRRRRTRLRARRLRPGGHDGRAHAGLRTFARGRRPLR